MKSVANILTSANLVEVHATTGVKLVIDDWMDNTTVWGHREIVRGDIRRAVIALKQQTGSMRALTINKGE